MKINEVKKCILEGLEPYANLHGYKIKKQAFAIEKKEKEVMHRLYFTYNYWYDEVQLFPAVEVSIHKINEVILKFDGIAQNFHHKTYWQNLNKLAYWYQQKSLIDFEYEDRDKYKIFADTDINWVVEDCITKFEKYGIRYVDDFGSIEKIGKLFNPQNLNLDDDLLLRNLILGLITARLTENNYPETAKIYTDFVDENKSEISESYVDLFFKVKQYLE